MRNTSGSKQEICMVCLFQDIFEKEAVWLQECCIQGEAVIVLKKTKKKHKSHPRKADKWTERREHSQRRLFLCWQILLLLHLQYIQITFRQAELVWNQEVESSQTPKHTKLQHGGRKLTHTHTYTYTWTQTDVRCVQWMSCHVSRGGWDEGKYGAQSSHTVFCFQTERKTTTKKRFNLLIYP